MLNLFLEMILTRIYQIILEPRYFHSKRNFSVIITIANHYYHLPFRRQLQFFVNSHASPCCSQWQPLPFASIFHDNEIRCKVKLLRLDKYLQTARYKKNSMNQISASLSKNEGCQVFYFEYFLKLEKDPHNFV